MSNDLNRAKKAFQIHRAVSPNAAARKATLQMAMKRFEEENAKSSQVNGNGARLSRDSNNLLTTYLRRVSMFLTPSRITAGLVSGVSLAAIVMAISVQSTNFDPISIGVKGNVEDSETAISSDKFARLPQPKKDTAQNFGVVKSPAARNAPSNSNGIASLLSREPQMQERAPKSGGKMGISATFGADISAQQEIYPPSRNFESRDEFEKIDANTVKLVSETPVSTFSVDVDTASYSFVRAALNRGVLPPKDAVRVEEMVNYFSYDYEAPTDPSVPFSTNISIMPTPWNAETKLLQVGIKGYLPPATDMPAANLVFLIDTSGSMKQANKLPLLRTSFKLLLSKLKPSDTISMVTYAGSAGIALGPTKVGDKAAILSALDNLKSGGRTAGADGIKEAYRLAESQMIESGVNRVILATDGDFNVGITDPEELKNFVKDKRKSGVTLSVLGFGQGNYNDALMQKLAQNGDGNAAYIDTLSEARKVLVEQVGGTLFTIAKDVKLQLEFNPAMVSEYRLIGYETRQLNREDFNNDKVDAGDIGAGHTVTALYEFTPVGSKGKRFDNLRYQAEKTEPQIHQSNEYAFMKIRYKQPDSDKSHLISTAVSPDHEVNSVLSAPEYARFAAAVAGFGQLLRGGEYTGSFSYDDVATLAQSARGDDHYNYRGEFLSLVQMAKIAERLHAQ